MAATVAKSIRLDADIDARLILLAEQKHRAPHYLMREAIAQYLEREEKRRQLLQDSIAAAGEDDLDGGGVTLAQARKHMRALEKKAAE